MRRQLRRMPPMSATYYAVIDVASVTRWHIFAATGAGRGAACALMRALSCRGVCSRRLANRCVCLARHSQAPQAASTLMITLPFTEPSSRDARLRVSRVTPSTRGATSSRCRRRLSASRASRYIVCADSVAAAMPCRHTRRRYAGAFAASPASQPPFRCVSAMS